MSIHNDHSGSPKKPYQAPTLRVYGELHEITQSGSPGTHIDVRNPYSADRTT